MKGSGLLSQPDFTTWVYYTPLVKLLVKFILFLEVVYNFIYLGLFHINYFFEIP